jgi:hypothetical protein
LEKMQSEPDISDRVFEMRSDRLRNKSSQIENHDRNGSPAPNVVAQWHQEAERAAYDGSVNAELLMNLQPGQAVVQIPGPFPRGIPIQFPEPTERQGHPALLAASMERWGVPRPSSSATADIQDEPTDDEDSHEQFLQQKPARRPRRR